MKRKVCMILAATVALLVLSGVRMSFGQADEKVLAAASTLMYRVVYKDQNGRIWKVNENGFYPEMIESETCGVVNTAATSSGCVIITLQYSPTCWQIYNCPGDGMRIPLAVDSSKSVFLAYDSVYDQVYFARNYDENLQKGDLYAVPSWGGSWILLAKNAYWGDIVGDRAVFMTEGYLGKRDILTVRYDGTQYAGIGSTNDDECYAGKFGNNVIFNRLVGGKQKDLFIAPATGGSGTALGTNMVYDDLYAGNGASRIYYTVDYKNMTNSLKSVLPNGSGKVEYVGYMNTWKTYLGEIGDRLLFNAGDNLYSLTTLNGGLIQFPLSNGRLWDSIILPNGRATVFFDRFIYASGLEFGWTSCTVSATNTDNVNLVSQNCKHEVYTSWTSRRLIVTLGLSNKPKNLLRSYDANGKNEVKFGDTYTQAKIYICSTANRHIYAYQSNSRRGLWSVRSVWLNGTGDVSLAESIPFDNLGQIIAY